MEKMHDQLENEAFDNGFETMEEQIRGVPSESELKAIDKMTDNELKNELKIIDFKVKNQHITENFASYNSDCNLVMSALPENSMHFSIFSPPFPELYTYSDNIADLGNCNSFKQFNENFDFVAKGLNRVMMPGRAVAVHCMDIPLLKSKHDVIGLYDFTGDLIKIMSDNGFIYESRVTIWKNPVVEQQRTKAKGLLMKNILKDAAVVRTGHPDYLLKFVKKGQNTEPIIHFQHEHPEWLNYVSYEELSEAQRTNFVSLDWWQKAASPVWMDIRQGRTLNNYKEARTEKDVKHICPLQLDIIERAVIMWSNPGETVLSPFGGVGSEGHVSLKKFRKSISIELKEEYFHINVKNHRAATENKQLTLF